MKVSLHILDVNLKYAGKRQGNIAEKKGNVNLRC